jgi:hypothetical protein
LGLGGEITGGGAASLVAFFDFSKMGKTFGFNFCISSSECSDSTLLLSDSSAMLERCAWFACRGVCGTGKFKTVEAGL